MSELNSVVPEPDPTPHRPVNPSHASPRLWRMLRSAQKYSAYTFTVFACLHVTSVAVLPAVSHDAAESAFMFARTIYQNSLCEATLVFGSAAVHVLSGFILHAHRVYVRYRDYGKFNLGASVMSVTGYALFIMLVAHATVNRLAPLIALGDSSLISLDYITHALHTDKISSSAGLMTIAALYFAHALLGSNFYLRLRLRKRTLAGLWAAGVTLTLSSLVALASRPDITGFIANQFEEAHALAMSWIK